VQPRFAAPAHPKESAPINEYDFLKGSVSSLIHHNKMMEASLQRQSSTLRTIFLDKLLKGEFDAKAKLDALMSHVGMRIDENAFVVIILKINRHDALISQSILAELDIFRAVIEGILQKLAGDNCYLHVLNENELALLLNFTADSCGISTVCAPTACEPTALVDNIIQNISREVASLYPITPVFGVGNVYYDLFDVHDSFIEARQALNFMENNPGANRSVIWYNRLKKEGGIYYYPNDLEQKLINFAKSGSWDLLGNTLDKIFDENFRKRVLSNPMKKTLLVDMQSTLLKLLEETQLPMNMEKEIDALSTKKHPEEFFQLLKESYQKICDAAINHRKSHNAQLKQSILEFVDANFTDANLSVYLVASRFHLSESYFSQFFKEQTGVTFSNYVESARIKLACRLITEGGLTIDELAGRTGYNGAHSFRRAFKKVMGIVPTAYGDPGQPKI
jgi:AraC-like DNA-binding protein